MFSASRAISLAASCVSLVTLENTMLSTFGGDMTARATILLQTLSGGGISLFILGMAVYMILHASQTIKHLED